MRRAFVLAVLLLAAPLLSACAERWEKPGASEADFRAMKAQCDAQAFERWPPVLREQLMFPGRWVPPVRSCDPRGRCVWYGGWYEPPQTMIVDDHERPRRAERRACYMGNGWTPVEE